MTIRAKFKVMSVTQDTNGHSVHLMPVTGGSDENKSFFKWTPSGEIKLSTINAEAAKEFEPGKEFYIDFTASE